MKRTAWTTLALLPFAALTIQAQPPGRGPQGRGPGGGGGGPIPAEAQEAIHTLFSGRGSIARQVPLTEKGYKSRTTSKDPRIVAKLQEHVAYVEARLDSGFPVRRWDPAFEEFFRHYDQLETKITKLENGLEVEGSGKTPEAVKVAQNHSEIISGFVAKGEVEHHAKHPAALADKDNATGEESFWPSRVPRDYGWDIPTVVLSCPACSSRSFLPSL